MRNKNAPQHVLTKNTCNKNAPQHMLTKNTCNKNAPQYVLTKNMRSNIGASLQMALSTINKLLAH